MGNFDKCNAEGWYDEQEPPFTDVEIQQAMHWRETYGRWTPGREDKCPHPTPCASYSDCCERIAWYMRHRLVIEAALQDGDEPDGYVLR